jgi:hypothetical protein
MRVRVPSLVSDKMTAEQIGIPPLEPFYVKDEPFFLDGPVMERVAVLDLDPLTGELHPGARFNPRVPGKDYGAYMLADPDDGRKSPRVSACLGGSFICRGRLAKPSCDLSPYQLTTPHCLLFESRVLSVMVLTNIRSHCLRPAPANRNHHRSIPIGLTCLPRIFLCAASIRHFVSKKTRHFRLQAVEYSVYW